MNAFRGWAHNGAQNPADMVAGRGLDVSPEPALTAPMTDPDTDDLITSHPAVMGGRRVFRGTRVPVEVLWENLDDGMTVEEILAEYETLDRADVLAVVEKGLR